MAFWVNRTQLKMSLKGSWRDLDGSAIQTAIKQDHNRPTSLEMRVVQLVDLTRPILDVFNELIEGVDTIIDPSIKSYILKDT